MNAGDRFEDDSVFPETSDAVDGERLVCGIAAMEKKCSSKPMQQILGRLARFEHIDVLVFPESVILNEPPEAWPLCDAFLSFYSNGFPLEKAIEYADLRKPFLINDLETQLHLQDRQRVHETLAAHGVELPRYAVLIRDPTRPNEADIVEHDDWIEIGDQVFHKPFVEKPLSAEDHNVYIYYPSSAGGGSQRLFRKIGSRSSVYSSESRIRREGSYIYEEFTPTDGTDVKVYTVGPDYAHAEARKSPALDGKVDRDADGKEIRYPVILSAREKVISRTIVLAFKQNVCGFDLLRTNGKTFVCDVNGFSFVKNSNKYYDDCAKILGNMIMRELGERKGIPWVNAIQIDEDCPIVTTTSGAMMELRCVTAVLRHGDRTPKQKMKMEIRHPKFFEIFEKYGGYTKGNVKLKHPTQLQEILDLTRFLLREMDTGGVQADNIEEKRGKLLQMVVVLELYGHFSGVYRKCILRYPKSVQAGGSAPASMTSSTTCVTTSGSPSAPNFNHRDSVQSLVTTAASSSSTTQLSDCGRRRGSGEPRGGLISSSEEDANASRDDDADNDRPRLELVLKWGGELTPAGRIQAEELGKAFRRLYPDTVSQEGNAEDVGLDDPRGFGGATERSPEVELPGTLLSQEPPSKPQRRSSFPKSSSSSQDSETEDAGNADYKRSQSTPTRRLRPSGNGSDLGLGLLRLQSTFRHDLKIYASDEGRVQMTAAAFTKGLLDLEGELTPILVQMVKSANTNGLLDNDSQVASLQNVVKARIHSALQKTTDFDDADYEILARGGSSGSKAIFKAMKFVRNPTKMCERIANLIADMLRLIKAKRDDPNCQNDVLYHQESWDLMYRRWEKLKKDFKMKNGKFDISKVPDIYDCIKYDYQHNQRFLEFKRAQEFFTCSKALADLVIPLEYGINVEEKLDIGQGILTPLLRKIRMDFQRVIENDFDLDDCSRLDPRYSNYRYTKGIQSPYRHVRTRLYFTSESHIHSFLNVIQFGGLCDDQADSQWRRAMEYLSAVSELNYLTQIVIMLYEDPKKEPSSEERFHVELHFSAGAITGILEKNVRSYSMAGVVSPSSVKKCKTEPPPTPPPLRERAARCRTVAPEPAPAPLSKSPTTSLPAVSEEGSGACTPIGNSSGPDRATLARTNAEEGVVHEVRPLEAPLSQTKATGLADDDTLDGAKKKLASMASDSSTSPPRKGEGPSRPPSKSDVSSDSSSFLSSSKHQPYATFHGVSSVARPRQGVTFTSLFSTKLLTGSSSAPNLLDLDYVTAASANEKLLTCGEGIPSIRPLETLHCSLSLRQLDRFMEKLTDPAFRNLSSSSTPQSSPPSGRGKPALSMIQPLPPSLQQPSPLPPETSAPVVDVSMSSVSSSPGRGEEAGGDLVSMTSSLASIPTSPGASRSNSPTIMATDHSFCSESVKASTELSPLAMDDDSCTRDSIMQQDTGEN